MIKQLWSLFMEMLQEPKIQCDDCRKHVRWWKGEMYYSPYLAPDSNESYYCFKCSPKEKVKK